VRRLPRSFFVPAAAFISQSAGIRVCRADTAGAI
jgi:hypothetical protein